MKRIKGLIAVFWLLALIATACTGTTPTESVPVTTTEPQTAAEPATTTEPEPVTTTAPDEPAATEPVVLKIGWLGEPDTLNPAYAFLTEAYEIFDLVYGTLTTEAPDGKYVGNLASEWSHSDDGLVWTFKLKDGILWHTGENFTAQDMAWAINAVMNDPDGWSTSSSYVIGFTEVIATDDKTVQITLESPIGNMEYRLSFLYAVYPKDFESFTTSEDLQNFPNDKPIGTGAFKMNIFDKDKSVVILDANIDYYDGAPKIDQVIFQTFDNADAMVQALKVGDVDFINEVPNAAFETVKGFENVRAVQLPGRYFAEMIINSVPADHDPAPNRNPALEDPQVRLALAQAMNKQDLVDIVLQGLGKQGVTLVPPTLGGGFWQAPIDDIPFDLEAANQTLEAAGYVKGSDGVRSKGDMRLEFRLQFPSDNSLYPRAADLITGWYREIGVKTTPESVDPDSLYAATTPTGDYDLVLWGWGPDPDPDFILSVMTTDQFVDGGWSDSGYMNPEYDQLYLDQQVAVDPAERQKIIWEMQQMVFDDIPYIIMWYEDVLQAYRTDRFTGFIESTLGMEISLSLVQVEPVK